MFLSIIGVALFMGDTVSSSEQKKKTRRKLLKIDTLELQLVVVVMFALFVGCALFGEPEKASSTGIHQGFTRDPVLAKKVEVVHTVLKVSVFSLLVLFCLVLLQFGTVELPLVVVLMLV